MPLDRILFGTNENVIVLPFTIKHTKKIVIVLPFTIENKAPMFYGVVGRGVVFCGGRFKMNELKKRKL